jgi:FkbM family methyltransferase
VASAVFGGRFSGNTRELLQQYIYYFGMWEPYLTRWVSQRLVPGDTFIDVGANIGYFSLLASRLVGPSGRVVAIEASPKTFHQLEGNVALNHAGNIRTVNMAASDSKGVAKLFGGPESHIGLATIVEEWADTHGRSFECEVETAPLSAILQPNEIQSTRLMKIDVEGAEWSVLSGMRPLLNEGRPDLEIMVELSHEDSPKVIEMFSDAGFYPYTIENDYTADGYLPPYSEKRPVRMRGPIDQPLTDAIFSRQDVQML